MRKERLTPLLLIAPTLAILIVIVVFPMVYSIAVSLLKYDLRLPEHPFIGAGNYVRVFEASKTLT